MKLSWICATFVLLSVVTCGMALVEEDNDFADFEYDIEDDAAQKDVNFKTQEDSRKKVQQNDDDNDDADVQVEDEFDHFSDKEEFEGFGGREPLENGIPDPKGIKLKQIAVPMHGYHSYWLEMTFIAGLIVYFTNYMIGKSKNVALANTWYVAHKAFLEENFALVGDDGKKETDASQSSMMVKESDSIFTLWCSGRVCCEGMLVELRQIKRQDLLAIVMGMLGSKVKDQVVIKTEISKDSMDTFVFAVCSKKSASKMSKDSPDLKQFCVSLPKDKYNIPEKFTVFSEIPEATNFVLDSRVMAILNKYEDILDYIHVSDQFSETQAEQDAEPQLKKPSVKRMLVISFFIPEKSEMEDLRPLLQLVIYLIDKLRRFKLSREAKTKSDKNRMRVEEEFLKSLHNVRMEAAAQKNTEKRKQEKEKIMNEDNAERQVRLERKMKRKEAKKTTPKMKSMSIHL